MPGQYELFTTVFVQASGVVIQGGGDDPDEVEVFIKGPVSPAFSFKGDDSNGAYESFADRAIPGTAQVVTDAYVPLGANKVTVADASDFNQWQKIILFIDVNQNWIDALGQTCDLGSALTPGEGKWTADSQDYFFVRTITDLVPNINGSWSIVLDGPVLAPLDPQFGTCEVSSWEAAGLIEDVGLDLSRSETETATTWLDWGARAFRFGRTCPVATH